MICGVHKDSLLFYKPGAHSSGVCDAEIYLGRVWYIKQTKNDLLRALYSPPVSSGFPHMSPLASLPLSPLAFLTCLLRPSSHGLLWPYNPLKSSSCYVCWLSIRRLLQGQDTMHTWTHTDTVQCIAIPVPTK